MLKLNIPPADIRIENRLGRLHVWDYIRCRWVVLTPEEWVRQQFSHWMTDLLGYPQARLGHEIGLSLNGMSLRADAVFYDMHGSPLIIMEFKAPHIAISQKTFDQICRYNHVMHVPYLIVSNGMQHYCCHISDDGIHFLKDIPDYRELI